MFSIVCSFAISLSSCSDSCDESQAEADSNRINELSQIYIDDITNNDKCQDFVDAVRQFVSDYRDCDGVNQTDLDSIESSIQGLPCG